MWLFMKEDMKEEYFRKQKIIMNDNSLDTKTKGRLLFKLHKKYFPFDPEKHIENEKEIKDDMKYFKKLGG